MEGSILSGSSTALVRSPVSISTLAKEVGRGMTLATLSQLGTEIERASRHCAWARARRSGLRWEEDGLAGFASLPNLAGVLLRGSRSRGGLG